jgi:hypothetical protein
MDFDDWFSTVVKDTSKGRPMQQRPLSVRPSAPKITPPSPSSEIRAIESKSHEVVRGGDTIPASGAKESLHEATELKCVVARLILTISRQRVDDLERRLKQTEWILCESH